MGEVGLTVLTCSKSFLLKGIGVKCGGVLELKGKHLPVNYPSKRQCHDQRKITLSKSRSPLVIKNQMTKPATYSSRISTDTPLFESPEVLSLSHSLSLLPVYRCLYVREQARHKNSIAEAIWLDVVSKKTISNVVTLCRMQMNRVVSSSRFGSFSNWAELDSSFWLL